MSSNGAQSGRRLSVVKYPWHTGHDYELSKLNHDLHFLSSTPRRWDERARPIPDDIGWITSYGNGEHFDAMILHVDQWTYHEVSKRALFLEHRNRFQGPKIVVNHGCNMVDGCSSEAMRQLVGDCVMVCNSTTAKELWGMEDSHFIRHGMSPEEWPQTDYANNNIVLVSPYSKLHQAYRNVSVVDWAEKYVPVTWVGRDKKFRNFEAYKHFLASSSVFFQPSFASPNPRARTEAMLCGVAIVTTNKHGEDEFIENEVNGFASNDMSELVRYLQHLHERPEVARRIGRAGRATAQSVFHIDRFRAQWDAVLSEIVY